MDKCSYFIPNKALFGSFPTQDSVEELENNGVRYFIDLTFPNEKKTHPYRTRYNYISFPIIDHGVPSDWHLFYHFLVNIANIINNLPEGEMVYIHCKGGHGRSGVVVSCLLCYMLKINTVEALEMTKEFHNKRNTMKEKWRILGAPNSKFQRDFVHKFFNPIGLAIT